MHLEASSMDEVRRAYLKTLAREKIKTSVIAPKLKRSIGTTYQKAMKLGVTLGACRRKKRTWRCRTREWRG
jgi:hypothetical protein